MLLNQWIDKRKNVVTLQNGVFTLYSEVINSNILKFAGKWMMELEKKIQSEITRPRKANMIYTHSKEDNTHKAKHNKHIYDPRQQRS